MVALEIEPLKAFFPEVGVDSASLSVDVRPAALGISTLELDNMEVVRLLSAWGLALASRELEAQSLS